MRNELPTAALAIHSDAGIHAQSTTHPGADLIVFNAKIFTGNLTQPEASAFAVKNGRIYSVGTDDEILDLKNSGTHVIDAGGRRVIPGINDAHMHLLNEVRIGRKCSTKVLMAGARSKARNFTEGHLNRRSFNPRFGTFGL